MERTSEGWEKAPASWRPASEAKPQGPKVAHCGGTGVCVVLGPFAFSPLAPACSNMAWPSLHCSAGTHQATQLWPNSSGRKTVICSSVWPSIRLSSSSSLQIALVCCCKVFTSITCNMKHVWGSLNFEDCSALDVSGFGVLYVFLRHQPHVRERSGGVFSHESFFRFVMGSYLDTQLGLNLSMNFWKWTGLAITGRLAF